MSMTLVGNIFQRSRAGHVTAIGIMGLESLRCLGGGDTDDESSLGSDNGEMTASNYTSDEGDHDQIMVDSIAKPKFLGIGKFFSGSRRASSIVRARDGTILIALGG